jgi:hypothetical protein
MNIASKGTLAQSGKKVEGEEVPLAKVEGEEVPLAHTLSHSYRAECWDC